MRVRECAHLTIDADALLGEFLQCQRAERLIAAIELVGSDGRGDRRERAKAACAIKAQVYWPPRVTAAAGRLPKSG